MTNDNHPKVIVYSVVNFYGFGQKYSDTYLLLCVCSVTQSCSTLCDPVDCSPPDGVVAFSFSRESSRLRGQTCISCVSCIGSWILYHCATWDTCISVTIIIINSVFIALKIFCALSIPLSYPQKPQIFKIIFNFALYKMLYSLNHTVCVQRIPWWLCLPSRKCGFNPWVRKIS